MFSRIILATDLTSASMEVVNCIHGLEPVGTKDILLTLCISTYEGASLTYAYSDEELKAILKEREDILVKKGFSVKSEVVFGSAHKELNKIAQERNYSAIVIGSHDHSLSKDILLGNVATEMIHHSTKPILVVRLELTDDNSSDKVKCEVVNFCGNFHSSVLFPTDFSENAEAAFLYVEKLAKSGAENITLLHVQDNIKLRNISDEKLKEYNEIDKGRLNQLKNRLVKIDKKINIQTKIVYGKPGPEIVKVSQNINPSLIVMGNKGIGYIKELLMGSVCHYVTRLSGTNALLVPLPKE